jgi:hypothetical protein
MLADKGNKDRKASRDLKEILVQLAHQVRLAPLQTLKRHSEDLSQ